QRIVPVRKIEETRLTCHHRLLRIADEVNQIRRSNARVFRGVQLLKVGRRFAARKIHSGLLPLLRF
ncbi:MAG: hypothetical protein ACOY4N_01660, partial [Pseudomonadota bacterium]